MTLGEYVCTVDSVMYALALEDIRLRIRTVMSNPFIKDQDSAIKSLHLEARALESDYMNLKDIT